MIDEYVETDRIEEEVLRELPVMMFYEEPEHLRIMIRAKSGIVIRYLTREHATQMMRWIGAKGTDIKSDVLILA